MQSILRLAAASPRVQRSVSMRSGTGWGSHGHSSMQVRNENTLHTLDPTTVKFKTGILSRIKLLHLCEKQRPSLNVH